MDVMVMIVESSATQIDCTVDRNIPCSFRPYHPHLQPAFDIPTMADATDPRVAAELKKKRTFRTFSYRGIELEKLLDLSNEEVGA